MLTYDIVLEGQLGARSGRLSWQDAADGSVTGTLSILGRSNPVRGQKRGAHVALVHELRTAISVLQCRTELELDGDSLRGTVSSEHGSLLLHGKIAEKGSDPQT